MVMTLPALGLLLGLLSITRFSAADAAMAPAEGEKSAATESGDDDEGGEFMLDPLGPNAACYVCHTTFVFEELARVHLAEKTTCIECHGLSAAHANDEHIGATKPDIVYKHDAIDASCKKCHEKHDAPASEVVALYRQRELKDPKPVCTDCHGTHRIEHAGGEEAQKAETDLPARHSVPVGRPR